MLLTAVIDTVTRTVIRILLIVAAAVVVFGLYRAYLGRRRLELVITDTVAPKELPPSLIADLSEQLRIEVQCRLQRPIPHRESLNDTVGKDLANHIAEIRGIDAREVGRIQEAILQAPRQELLASPRDALAAVSGGIRALNPKEAEGSSRCSRQSSQHSGAFSSARESSAGATRTAPEWVSRSRWVPSVMQRTRGQRSGPGIRWVPKTASATRG